MKNLKFISLPLCSSNFCLSLFVFLVCYFNFIFIFTCSFISIFHILYHSWFRKKYHKDRRRISEEQKVKTVSCPILKYYLAAIWIFYFHLQHLFFRFLDVSFIIMPGRNRLLFLQRIIFHSGLWLPHAQPPYSDVNCLILPLLLVKLCNISPDLTRVLMRVEVLCGNAVSGWHHCTGGRISTRINHYRWGAQWRLLSWRVTVMMW